MKVLQANCSSYLLMLVKKFLVGMSFMKFVVMTSGELKSL